MSPDERMFAHERLRQAVADYLDEIDTPHPDRRRQRTALDKLRRVLHGCNIS